jgi:homoserine O-acetyltransferase/O-succinyltransferase
VRASIAVSGIAIHKKESTLMRLTSSIQARFLSTFLSCIALTFASTHVYAQRDANVPVPQTQSVNLGECALENGATIRDCAISFTTVGALNAARDNAILWPTWYGGRSVDLLQYIGADKLADPTRFFVIAVDSVGNGVSSSPSTSATQKDALFPNVTLRDMTRMQMRLLREHFKLDRVHAVMGISMGAMQTFDWAVWQPEFASKFVAIAGSPRLAPYDMVLWQTHTRLIRMMLDCGNKDDCQMPMQVMAGMRFLTNVGDNQNAPHESRDMILANIANNKMDPKVAYDRLLQMSAMMNHDVSKQTNGDLAAAAKRVAPGKLLVIVGNKDQVVTPLPALQFAKSIGAKALEFPMCGHEVPRCQSDLIFPAVRDFLAR